MQHKTNFPFTGIVGQDDFKLCLILNLIDPTIGGVLATGDKGTGKTTTVRALSQLMGNDFPFVNLPIGATEDSVLGSVNLEVLLKEQKTLVKKGLLAKAHQGFLYIDEVNLLNEYLMDVLLDASASGGYHLEREGISQWLDSRFCLVGTMNPEEGALRPQLLDRFGLNVLIETPKDISVRKQIADHRFSFDTNPEAFYETFKNQEVALQQQITVAKTQLATIVLTDAIKEMCAQLTLQNHVEGMRADILLLKSTRAYASFLNKSEVTEEHVLKIAPFVLQHRSKEYNPPSNNNQKDNNNNESSNDSSSEEKENHRHGEQKFQLPETVKNELKFTSSAVKKKGIEITKLKGIQNTNIPQQEDKSLAVFKTVKEYLITGNVTPIYKYKHPKSMLHIVFLIDTSASMAIGKQIAYIKGLILKTIEANPLKKIKYAVVALANNSSKIVQPFTSNTHLISEISSELKTQGKTNLKDAFLKVYELLKSVNKKAVQLFVMTDGKINHGGDQPFEIAIQTYKTYLSNLKNTTIIDTESGFIKLGRAKNLASQLKVSYMPLSQLNS
ncbi:VWA domain-containing protein [Tenacibaculum sp. M341]|uniref:VWA domain-containing protein n=1 Tax=Tenacibaculum sp. M341 TaxID=2530339 RepID=UPI001043725D|nr:VWA domain-containing protein [Tenacibaculum sp. M341]TCI93739.1 VWA domain-containing protein [Tenacibaculum sp. M341]